VDKTAARAKELGGRLYVEPMDLPKIGRYAVVADPQGASIAIVHTNEPMAPHDVEKHGEFCWNELVTTDHKAAFTFYHELFGWEHLADHDMGPMGTYLLYGRGGKQVGGMFTKPRDMPMPAAFLYYVQVDSLDAALTRANKHGAKVLNGPIEVPGGAHIVQLMDPQGAAFALHEKAPAK
jgi:predicted enzyme related to lactoylglutathione lyase